MKQVSDKVKSQQIKQIQKDLLDFTLCSNLVKFRQDNNYLPVIGEGSHQAQIMFIGEAPGKKEALSGRPFCGLSGKILDNLLKGISLKRSDVYITNLVKDRPPENRDPTREEIEAYVPFLNRQIMIIKPQVIISLGRLPMTFLLNHFKIKTKFKTIGKLHGRPMGVIDENFNFIFLPLYHPAASIYNQKLKTTLKKDFTIIKKFMINA